MSLLLWRRGTTARPDILTTSVLLDQMIHMIDLYPNGLVLESLQETIGVADEIVSAVNVSLYDPHMRAGTKGSDEDCGGSYAQCRGFIWWR